MKKSTTFQTLIQSVLTESEIQTLAQSLNYDDTARKFTVHTLLLYWVQAAFEQWNGYREGADRAPSCGLPEVDYSTFSKKAKDVPFELFKMCFHQLIQKCNRQMMRKLQFPKELLLVDSTTITVGKTRLPWAPYHGNRSAIKLHVAFSPEVGQPQQVIESIGSKHDGPVGEELANPDFILVEDRAYGKIERLDCYQSEKQSYVIRLKDNVQLANSKTLRR
ncbi:transposase, partial [Paenibacillus sp.]|uniref:transposase n=1 Tax=Paenibacillus sp. TaxID=58172 RepID=UPI0028371F02